MKFTTYPLNYQRLLYEKMQNEFIIQAAYEVTYKRKILCLFANENIDFLSLHQLETLYYKSEHPLDELYYNAWLKVDSSESEIIKEALQNYMDRHYPTQSYRLKVECHFDKDMSDVSYEHDALMRKEYPKKMVQYVRGSIAGNSCYTDDVFNVHHKDVTNENGAELMRVFHYITETYFPTYNKLLEYCDMREMEDERCTDDGRSYWFYTESTDYNYSVRLIADKGDCNLYLYQYKK